MPQARGEVWPRLLLHPILHCLCLQVQWLQEGMTCGKWELHSSWFRRGLCWSGWYGDSLLRFPTCWNEWSESLCCWHFLCLFVCQDPRKMIHHCWSWIWGTWRRETCHRSQPLWTSHLRRPLPWAPWTEATLHGLHPAGLTLIFGFPATPMGTMNISQTMSMMSSVSPGSPCKSLRRSILTTC